MRVRAGDAFSFDNDDLDERHHIYGTYEERENLGLDMFAWSKPFLEMPGLFAEFEGQYGLKIPAMNRP